MIKRRYFFDTIKKRGERTPPLHLELKKMRLSDTNPPPTFTQLFFFISFFGK